MNNYSYNHILLIEDSEIDVLVYRRLMELMHFAAHVTITSTAEEAVDFLRNEVTNEAEAPELILLDMHLPGMSGFDFLKIFESLPEFILHKSKVIVLSVFQKPDDIRKISENKFVTGQLEKPLTQDSLRKLMLLKEQGPAVLLNS
ncbi:response regulator [soil metagenome]